MTGVVLKRHIIKLYSIILILIGIMIISYSLSDNFQLKNAILLTDVNASIIVTNKTNTALNKIIYGVEVNSNKTQIVIYDNITNKKLILSRTSNTIYVINSSLSNNYEYVYNLEVINCNRSVNVFTNNIDAIYKSEIKLSNSSFINTQDIEVKGYNITLTVTPYNKFFIIIVDNNHRYIRVNLHDSVCQIIHNSTIKTMQNVTQIKFKNNILYVYNDTSYYTIKFNASKIIIEKNSQFTQLTITHKEYLYINSNTFGIIMGSMFIIIGLILIIIKKRQQNYVNDNINI